MSNSQTPYPVVGPMKQLWSELSDFVARQCSGRDASHGHQHMATVADNSVKIYQMMLDDAGVSAANLIAADVATEVTTPRRRDSPTSELLLDLIIIVAWLHDVNDSKYASAANQQAIDDFLAGIHNRYPKFHHVGEADFIRNINTVIYYISYSKEVKLFGKLSEVSTTSFARRWSEVLPEDLILVRNIVSDADKLESIGEIGVQRCLEYSMHVNPDIKDYNTHLKHVFDHYDDKLQHLYPHYIVTPAGKRLAEPRHQIMADIITTLKLYYPQALASGQH